MNTTTSPRSGRAASRRRVIGFSVGKVAATSAAGASAAQRYTPGVGDTVTIPAINQRCAVYTEGGASVSFSASCSLQPERVRRKRLTSGTGWTASS